MIAVLLLVGSAHGENILVSVVPSAESPSNLSDFNVTLIDCNGNQIGHKTDINGKTSIGMIGCPCDITASKIEPMPNEQRLCYYGQMHIEHNTGYVQILVDKMCDCSVQKCTCCPDNTTNIQRSNQQISPLQNITTRAEALKEMARKLKARS